MDCYNLMCTVFLPQWKQLKFLICYLKSSEISINSMHSKAIFCYFLVLNLESLMVGPNSNSMGEADAPKSL
jgi:hypothetical protein